MSEHSLEQALAMARRSLEVLETQAAGYSVLTIPAHLFLELEEKRKEIARLEAQARAAAGTPGAGLPHNLPRRGEFVGRAVYKARVHEALRSRSYLVSIEGIGGIGKTSLALEVAYECLQPGESMAHFDGAIWASARDRSLNLDDVLDAVARTLDYPGIAQKSLEEKREGVVRLLRSGAYLLLVDNFETITDPAVGEFLQDLPEPSKALVTTRERKLERAWTIPLKGLEEAEALALIRAEGRRIGMPALGQAEDSLLLPLCTATGGVPLALKWAVGQIKQPGQSLETVLVALYEARGNLFDQMFARSWEMLTPEAQRVLMVMPMFATSATRKALEAVSGVRHYQLDQALDHLLELSLVDLTIELDATAHRYSVHPLTHAFALWHLRQEHDFGQLACERRLSYYHALVSQYRGVLSEAAFAALNTEVPNLLAVLDATLTDAKAEIGVDILLGIDVLLISQGYWNEVLIYNQRARDALNSSGNSLRAAQLQLWPLSWIYRHRNRLDIAQKLLDEAEPVFRAHGAARQLAYARRFRGRIAHERGDLEEAEICLQEALASLEELHDDREITITINNLAEVALDRGDLARAERLCRGRISDLVNISDSERMAVLHFTVGRVARQRSDLLTAREQFEQALTLARQANRFDAVVGCLVALAEVEFVEQNVNQAIMLLLQARDIYERLGITEKITQVNSLLIKYRAALNQEPPTHA